MAEDVYGGLPCPCGGKLFIVANTTRGKRGGDYPYLRRTRKCGSCSRSFTTYEIALEEGDAVVMSRNKKGIVVQTAFEWARGVADSIDLAKSLLGRAVESLK